MPFPNLPGKHDEKELFNPSHLVEYRRSIDRELAISGAKGAIICYQSYLLSYILEKHDPTPVKYTKDMYLVDDHDEKVVVKGFTVGSPAAVMALEEMAAYGIERFIAVGTAGALCPDLEIGDIVVCDSAIRDEGTSHHYLATEKLAHPSPGLTAEIARRFDERGIEYRTGPSWTLDALYRETLAEIKKYQEEGVLTVEMEAAALFAVAEYRGVDLAAVFAISDSLADYKWSPNFHTDILRVSLKKVYDSALEILRGE